MHELSLMEDLVETITRELEHERVAVVRLNVGRQSGVAAAALSFCFDVCVRGTSLEGATLEITESEGPGLSLTELEVS